MQRHIPIAALTCGLAIAALAQPVRAETLAFTCEERDAGKPATTVHLSLAGITAACGPAEPTATAPTPTASAHPASNLSDYPLDFQGTWQAVSGGVACDLILRVSGNHVTGEYSVPGQPSWNGTIAGTIRNVGKFVRLDYRWNSPALGIGDEGYWDVTLDGRLIGSFMTAEPGVTGKVSQRWDGVRLTRRIPDLSGGESSEDGSGLNYGKLARVIAPADVFDQAHGTGKKIGELQPGAAIRIVGYFADDWHEVVGSAVPKGRGYVHNGPGNWSLKED